MLNKDVEEMIFIAKESNHSSYRYEYTADQEFVDRLKKNAQGIKLMVVILADGPEGGSCKNMQILWFINRFRPTKIQEFEQAEWLRDWALILRLLTLSMYQWSQGGLGPDMGNIRTIKPYGVDSLSKTSFKFDDGDQKEHSSSEEFCEKQIKHQKN